LKAYYLEKESNHKDTAVYCTRMKYMLSILSKPMQTFRP